VIYLLLKFVKTHSANIDLWPAGESAAQEKLANFLQSKAQFYSESRNSPILMAQVEFHHT